MELDEQEIELVSAVIGRSYSNRCNITLTVYDAFQCREVIGTVTRVDQQLKRVRIASEVEYEWINKGDIIKLKLSDNVGNLDMFYYFYQYISRVIINFVVALYYEKWD